MTLHKVGLGRDAAPDMTDGGRTPRQQERMTTDWYTTPDYVCSTHDIKVRVTRTVTILQSPFSECTRHMCACNCKHIRCMYVCMEKQVDTCVYHWLQHKEGHLLSTMGRHVYHKGSSNPIHSTSVCTSVCVHCVTIITSLQNWQLNIQSPVVGWSQWNIGGIGL